MQTCSVLLGEFCYVRRLVEEEDRTGRARDARILMQLSVLLRPMCAGCQAYAVAFSSAGNPVFPSALDDHSPIIRRMRMRARLEPCWSLEQGAGFPFRP